MKVTETSIFMVVLLMVACTSFAESSNVAGRQTASERTHTKIDKTQAVSNEKSKENIRKDRRCETSINGQFLTDRFKLHEVSIKEKIQEAKDGVIEHINLEKLTSQKDNNGYSSVLTNLIFMVLGAIISLYGTIVFDRFKRFTELLRTVGEARQLYEGYPTSKNESELSRAHDRAMDYWRLLESKQWVLNSDHHYKAAAKLDILKNFAYRSIACIENMQNNKTKGLALDEYLSVFQLEYSKIKRDNFIQYEKSIKPSAWALLKPFPHPILPTKITTVMVDYFENLL